MPARPKDSAVIERARQLFRAGERLSDIAVACAIGAGTLYAYLVEDDHIARAHSKSAGSAEQTARVTGGRVRLKRPPSPGGALPPGRHEDPKVADCSSSPPLPEAFPQSYEPFLIDTPGVWLALMDCHIPYHDRVTVELAVAEARRRGAVGVLLNGDILDSHEISDHDKDPRAPRYVEELSACQQFLAWLRGVMPQARIIYKQGNHEERLERYIMRRAPALFGAPGVNLPAFLELPNYGVEWVADRRVIALGKLNVIHGHEYPGGVSSPVNPARGLYLKARSVAMAGHHHRTSEHHARDIRGRAEAAWSVGCACYLHPAYRPLNDWNHGFALVEVDAHREFAVQNHRVIGGKVF